MGEEKRKDSAGGWGERIAIEKNIDELLGKKLEVTKLK